MFSEGVGILEMNSKILWIWSYACPAPLYIRIFVHWTENIRNQNDGLSGRGYWLPSFCFPVFPGHTCLLLLLCFENTQKPGLHSQSNSCPSSVCPQRALSSPHLRARSSPRPPPRSPLSRPTPPPPWSCPPSTHQTRVSGPSNHPLDYSCKYTQCGAHPVIC